MRIVADENIPYVKEAFSTFGEVRTIPGRLISRSDLLNVQMLLVRSVTRVNAELLDGTDIRFVGTATAGIDHVDTGWLEKNNITFAYAPGSNSESVAQYVVAALVSLMKLHRFQPQEKTLGIVGVGNVGSKVARHAATLGFKTVLCDPPRQRTEKSSNFISREELCDASDIITFHVPLISSGSDCTDDMVDERFLTAIKPGTTLINTSRGEVFNEDAVRRHRDRIDGLILDVWKNEPAISCELLKMTTIATPHIAGYSFNGKINGTEAVYREACKMFNVPVSWDSRSCTESGGDAATIEVTKNPLEEAVLQAYPIAKDDAALRELLRIKWEERPEYFDLLRKKYRRRLEFSHFSVRTSTADSHAVHQLEELGFSNVLNVVTHPL